MKLTWKKALKALVIAALIVVFGGGALLVSFVFARLGLTPLYVTRIIPVVGIALLLGWILSAIGYLPSQWIKRVWLAVFCVCLGSAAYAGWGAYHDNIPTVDDHSLILRDYIPFDEENQLVT